MKNYKLNIITAFDNIEFNIYEPETKQESLTGLSNKKHLDEKTGMIYFAIDQEPCVDARMHTQNISFPLDFIFTDWYGNIQKIDKNIKPFSNKIYTCANCISVLALHGGDCDKFNIETGDSVIHEKLQINRDNTIIFNNIPFQKITKRNHNNIKCEDIAFVKISTSGAFGSPGTIQMFIKTDFGTKAFFLDKSGWDIESFSKIFPPVLNFEEMIKTNKTDDENWEFINMGFGNHLMVNKKYYTKFMNQIDNKNISQNWITTAINILS